MATSEESPSSPAAPSVRVAWSEPVLAWFLSRVVCIVAIVLGGALFPIERKINLKSDRSPNAGPKSDLRSFFHEYAGGFRDLKRFGDRPMIGVTLDGPDRWLRPFVHWDAVWWLSVAEVGYVADPKLKAQQNVVFYPLYPMLIRGVATLGVPLVLASLLVANGLMLIATCLLYQFVVLRSGVAAARWALACWLTFPAAFFGVVPYSEPLLAVLTILAMQALLTDRYILSGLWCGLASALKNQGVILGGALVVPFLRGPKRVQALIGMLLSGCGLLAYMAWLQHAYGDPLLFVEMQKEWRPRLGSNSNPIAWFQGLVNSSLHSIIVLGKSKSDPIMFYSGRMLDPWLGWWVLCWLPSVRRLHCGLLLSSIVMILLPLSTGTVASLGRYVWIILPVFVVMGERLSNSGWRWPVVLLSTVGLLWQAFLYGGGWEVI